MFFTLVVSSKKCVKSGLMASSLSATEAVGSWLKGSLRSINRMLKTQRLVFVQLLSKFWSKLTWDCGSLQRPLKNFICPSSFSDFEWNPINPQQISSTKLWLPYHHHHASRSRKKSRILTTPKSCRPKAHYLPDPLCNTGCVILNLWH